MVAARRLYDSEYLLEYGLRLIGHKCVGEAKENKANFKAAHGLSARAALAVWCDMWDSQDDHIKIGPEAKLEHFFWTLHFLRAYPLERNLAAYMGAHRRTVMKWVKTHVTKISLLKPFKIRLPEPDDIIKFFLTVDGTDCPINEPTPFNKNWMSHKFKGAAIKYEVGIDMQGNFAWISPPYRGSVHDSTIFKRSLRGFVPNGHCVIVDSAYGYKDEKVAPVSEYDDDEVTRFKKRSLARHETGNKRIKDWKVTSVDFRHSLDFHAPCFHSSVVLSQYNVEHGEPLFEL